MKLHRNIKLFINYLLAPLLFLWLSFSIYNHIQQQEGLAQAWEKIVSSLKTVLVWNLAGVVALMILNWLIEALKWKMAMKVIQDISLQRSFRAVLSGISFSVSTPNRVGEYLGRVLYMHEGNRLKAISLTIACSISQLVVTLLMGFIALVVLGKQIEISNLIEGPWYRLITWWTLIALLLLTLFYFRLSWLVRLFRKIPGTSKFQYLINSLAELNATLLLRLLSLSALRFIVFIIQYYLLFRLFQVDVSWWDAYWAVSLTFLVMAVIPTFAIAELGLRGEVSIKIIGLFSTNSLGIWMASTTIWLINLILPAVAGSLLILSIKRIFNNKTNADERI